MREQRNSSSSCGRPDASPSSSSSSSNSGGGSGSGEGSGGGCGGTTTGAVQFIAIRSRVGKRYQATIPDMLGEDARATKKQAVHIPNPQFCLDRANGEWTNDFAVVAPLVSFRRISSGSCWLFGASSVMMLTLHD